MSLMNIYLILQIRHQIHRQDQTFQSLFRLLFRLGHTTTLSALHSSHLISALLHVRRVLSLVRETSLVADRTHDRLSFPVHGAQVEPHVLLGRVRLAAVRARHAIGWIDVVDR